MDNKKEFYCRGCGRKLKSTTVGAENYYFESEAGRIHTNSAYNKKTGKRQVVFEYSCPDYRKSAWNYIFGQKHDNFMHEDVYQEIEFGKWELVY